MGAKKEGRKGVPPKGNPKTKMSLNSHQIAQRDGLASQRAATAYRQRTTVGQNHYAR